MFLKYNFNNLSNTETNYPEVKIFLEENCSDYFDSFDINEFIVSGSTKRS